MPRAPLEASVKAIIAQREKDERERKAEADRERRDAEKAEPSASSREQARKETAGVQGYSPSCRSGNRKPVSMGLQNAWTKTLRRCARSSRCPPVRPPPESVELWPEAVETAALLSELISQLRRFIVFRQDTDATAVALWIMFSWIHAVATHSPNHGRDVHRAGLRQEHAARCAPGRLTPRPVSGVELTGPALYRVVDRDHPTLLVDEADDLFHRKPDLKHIVNAGWTRGTKIPRVVTGRRSRLRSVLPRK